LLYYALFTIVAFPDVRAKIEADLYMQRLMGNSINFATLGKHIELLLKVVAVCKYFIFSCECVKYILLIQVAIAGLCQHKLIITYGASLSIDG
jgi:hypothetical protein